MRAIRNAPMRHCTCACTYVRACTFTLAERAAPVFMPPALPGAPLSLASLALLFFFSLPSPPWPHDSHLRARTLSRFALFRRKPRKKERGRLSGPQHRGFSFSTGDTEDATSLCDERQAIGDDPRFLFDRVSLLGNTQSRNRNHSENYLWSSNDSVCADQRKCFLFSLRISLDTKKTKHFTFFLITTTWVKNRIILIKIK